MQALEELCQAQRQIEQAIVEQVDELSRLGAGWGVIGRALGVTRQAARQRYGAGTARATTRLVVLEETSVCR